MNKSVKFEIKIPNGCWENNKKIFRGLLYFAAPGTWQSIPQQHKHERRAGFR